MRPCRKCRLPFEPSKNQEVKRDYICVPCRREYDAAWREKRRASGLPSSGSDSWDPKKKSAWQERYYKDPENRKRRAKFMKKYREDPAHRFKHIARWALHHALDSGKVRRMPCASCGNHESQGHHTDYSKPLVVVWLCAKCHRKEHAKAENK